MDQTAFYGVVSAINFTLLGLWWVAIKERADLRESDAAFRQMAYLVSLQFVIPATVSLLAQVAPGKPDVWRIAFSLAGIAGAVGVAMLAREMARQTQARIVPQVFAVVGVPLYVVVLVVALRPSLVGDVGLDLTPIEVEAVLLTVLVFLGVQEAWFVHMTPRRAKGPAQREVS
jgi:cytochrome bd-type quinol oxidase subunit 2